jgi:hypothetical protein
VGNCGHVTRYHGTVDLLMRYLFCEQKCKHGQKQWIHKPPLLTLSASSCFTRLTKASSAAMWMLAFGNRWSTRKMASTPCSPATVLRLARSKTRKARVLRQNRTLSMSVEYCSIASSGPKAPVFLQQKRSIGRKVSTNNRIGLVVCFGCYIIVAARAHKRSQQK